MKEILDLILLNWRSSVTGFVTGFAVLFAKYGVDISPELQTKASTWIIAGGIALLGLLTKDGAVTGVPAKEEPKPTDDDDNTTPPYGGFNNKAWLFIIALLLIAGSSSACLRKRSGETPEQTKARKIAVYLDQTMAGVDGTSDATEILVRGGQLSVGRGQSSYELNERVRKIVTQSADSIKQGKPKDAIGAIERGIAEIEQAERAGIFTIKDPNAASEFYTWLSVVKFGLDSVKSVIEASKEPELPEEAKSLLAATQQSKAQYWLDLITLGKNLSFKIIRISRMTADQAWADLTATSELLASKNSARLVR